LCVLRAPLIGTLFSKDPVIELVDLLAVK
jgi:hypothetical protein